MIIIKVKNNNIDLAIKQYRIKINKLKQIEKLKLNEEYQKKSVKLRNKKIKSIFVQKIKNQL
jgi:ribosomal protein S21